MWEFKTNTSMTKRQGFLIIAIAYLIMVLVVVSGCAVQIEPDPRYGYDLLIIPAGATK